LPCNFVNEKDPKLVWCWNTDVKILKEWCNNCS
jgi:hypothetical protein